MKEWSARAAKDPFARQSVPRILHCSFVLVLHPDRRGKNPLMRIATDPFRSILFREHRADQIDNPLWKRKTAVNNPVRGTRASYWILYPQPHGLVRRDHVTFVVIILLSSPKWVTAGSQAYWLIINLI